MIHIVLIEFRASTPAPVHLANALGELCRVTLMLPDAASSLIQAVNRETVDLQPFTMPRIRQPSNLAMVRRLRRRLERLHPHLIHITFWHPWGTPGLGVRSLAPLVATVHDVERHLGERGLWAIPPFLYRWQWHWARQVIVHATRARQRLSEQYGYPAERIHVIPLGRYDYYRALSSQSQPEEPHTILFFGRIWGYKGLQYLIKAEPLITRAVPDTRIIIAGHGEPFEKYRQAMVNPHHFEVYNYRIPDNEVAPLFQRASVVVLPYLEASQSGIIPIAYTFGKPVVATHVGGLPDVVKDGETGFLVPPADAQSLAEAVIRLLKDDALRHKMGQQAQQFAETVLSWSNIAQRTMDVYRLALND